MIVEVGEWAENKKKIKNSCDLLTWCGGFDTFDFRDRGKDLLSEAMKSTPTRVRGEGKPGHGVMFFENGISCAKHCFRNEGGAIRMSPCAARG